MAAFRYNLAFTIVAASLLIGVFIVVLATNAQEETITFPVPELGNCASKDACRAYCDKLENFKACVEFAENHNLISKEDARKAKIIAKANVSSGPGGCTSDKECKAYCENQKNIEECIAFAEKHDVLDPGELQEARKVAKALREGATLPGGCKGKASCEAYCEDPGHFEECVRFAEKAGFISKEEVEMLKKTGGQGPGGCRGKKACETYCEDQSHFEECIAFAEQHGFVSKEDARRARLTGGRGPGGCYGEECRTYCNEVSHFEECVDFAIRIGELKPEEAKEAKKFVRAGITSGPGGCKGKTECENFCNDPAHIDVCVEFSVQAGFMKPEEAEQVKKMGVSMKDGGPGGCRGRDQCEAYCKDPAHQEECMDFAVRMGFMKPEEKEHAQALQQGFMQGGPGGCKSETECKDFCSDPAHQEECFRFAKDRGIISEGAMPPPGEFPEQDEGQYPQPGTYPKSGPIITPREPLPPSPYSATCPIGQVPLYEGGVFSGCETPTTYTQPNETSGPGGCKTAEECRLYCSDPAHREECGIKTAPYQEPYPTYPSPSGTTTYPSPSPDYQQPPLYPSGSEYPSPTPTNYEYPTTYQSGASLLQVVGNFVRSIFQFFAAFF